MPGTDDTQKIESMVRQVLAGLESAGRSPAVAPFLTLNAARRLILCVEQQAEKWGVKAVVAVTSQAAHPIAVECMEDSFLASYDIALQKAYTAVALKRSTKELQPLAQPGGPLYGIQFTNQNRIVIFGGGVPLFYRDRLVGGLGVSGGTEEQDTALAEYGSGMLKEVIS